MYGFETTAKWHKHLAPAALENDQAQILWDFSIFTEKLTTAYNPDGVVIDKIVNNCQLIDKSVPRDTKVADKEQEEIEKYLEMAKVPSPSTIHQQCRNALYVVML